MNKLLVFCTGFVFLFLLPTFNSAWAVEPYNQAIIINSNPESTNSVRINHTFKVKGDSNTDLASGTLLQLPLSGVKILSAKVDNRLVKSTVNGEEIFIDFSPRLLKSGEEINVELIYELANIIETQLTYKLLHLNKLASNFSIKLVNNSINYSVVYTNFENSRNFTKHDNDILIVWENNRSQNLKATLNFNNIESNSLVPIISDNVGWVNRMAYLNGSFKGYRDDVGNYYLISDANSVEIQLDLFDFQHTISGKAFSNGNFSQVETDRIINEIIGKHHPEFSNPLSIYTDDLYSKVNLSNIEYAILTSQYYSKSGRENTIYYGLIYLPGVEVKPHYWVEYLEGGIVRIADPFISDIANVRPDYPVRFKFGILNSRNLSEIRNIEYLSKLNFFELSQNDEVMEKISSQNVRVDIFTKEDINYMQIVNNSNYFAFISNSNDVFVLDQFDNFLVLPGENLIHPISFKTPTPKYKSLITYNLAQFSFQQEFEVDVNVDYTEFYLRISLVLFVVLSLSLILIRSLYSFFIVDRNFFKYKNRVSKAVSKFKSRRK